MPEPKRIDQANERRQSMCPRCSTVRGAVYSNEVGRGYQRFTLQCRHCGLEWTTTRTVESSHFIGFAGAYGCSLTRT